MGDVGVLRVLVLGYDTALLIYRYSGGFNCARCFSLGCRDCVIPIFDFCVNFLIITLDAYRLVVCCDVFTYVCILKLLC